VIIYRADHVEHNVNTLEEKNSEFLLLDMAVHTGVGKSRFTVVSTRNTGFMLVLLL
jgi:hypothetical protein